MAVPISIEAVYDKSNPCGSFPIITFGLSKIFGSTNKPILGLALAGTIFLNCGYND